MVYRRKSSYRAKRPATRRTPRASTGSQILSLLKGAALTALKRRLGLNTETKFVDTAGTTTSTATLVSCIASPTIAQGLTVNTRQGANIRITKINQRISISAAAAATLGCNVRIITVRNKWSDSTIAVADILQTTTDFSSPFHNLFQEHGLELIQDETVRIGTATSDNSVVTIDRQFSRPNWQMTWTDADTTGVPSNLVRGAIQTFWMVDNVTTAPVFTSTNRLWFVDN